MIAQAKKSKASVTRQATQPNADKQPNICIVPKCGRTASTRGVCQSCYQNALKAVGRGTTSWDELVRFGLILPPHSHPRSPILAALVEMRQDKKGGSK